MPLAQITRFDPSAWEKCLPKGCFVERDTAILELCKAKKVLHLGAADSPFHEQAATSGHLLHQKLGKVAGALVGIDQDSAAVDFLRKNHGITDIICTDASSPIASPALKQRFDVVLCCDIIEHVGNPSQLLESCKRFMGYETLLIITTINALGAKPAVRALLGREAVHHDHVAYYSYGTLCSLLHRHGLLPTGAGFFSYGTMSLSAKLLFGSLARCAPGCADGILVASQLQPVS